MVVHNAKVKTRTRHLRSTEGHIVYYTATMPNLASLGRKPFEYDFNIPCDISPSSWKFKLVYLDVMENGDLLFSATLLRNDTKQIKVGAEISIRICDSKDCDIYSPIEFQKHEIGPVTRINQLEGMPPQIWINFCPNKDRKIVLKVTINIRYCHSIFDEWLPQLVLPIVNPTLGMCPGSRIKEPGFKNSTIITDEFLAD